MRDIDLAIRVQADAAGVANTFDGVGDSAVKMGDEIDKASKVADDAGDRLAGAADKADAIGSASAQAAGGLGDLGGALAMLPGPLGSLGAGMEAAAPAIMGVTGAADLANLALGSNVVANVKATAASAKHRVVSIAMTTATKAQTTAQRALNLVMRANPLMLVVTAGLLLAGLFVTLYKRSDTFRSIVDKAGRVGRQALGWVVDKAKDLGGWIADIPDRLESFSGAARIAKDLVVGYFKLMTTPIRIVVGLVKDLVGWVSKIDFPDMPSLPGWGRAAPGRGGGAYYLPGMAPAGGKPAGGSPAAPAVQHTTVYITVQGAVDRLGTARQIIALLREAGVTLGAPTGTAVFG